MQVVGVLSELHVIDGVPSFIFVKANYSIAVSLLSFVMGMNLGRLLILLLED